MTLILYARSTFPDCLIGGSKLNFDNNYFLSFFALSGGLLAI